MHFYFSVCFLSVPLRRVLEEAPLMTQSLREAQEKEKMDRYPKVSLYANTLSPGLLDL